MDESGEIQIPADEALVDVDEDNPDVAGGESPAEEAADEAGPFAEAPTWPTLRSRNRERGRAER